MIKLLPDVLGNSWYLVNKNLKTVHGPSNISQMNLQLIYSSYQLTCAGFKKEREKKSSYLTIDVQVLQGKFKSSDVGEKLVPGFYSHLADIISTAKTQSSRICR